MNNQEFGMAEKGGRIELSKLSRTAILQSLHFAVAVLTASASPEQYFSPLGIAFCSGTKREYTLFSCLGAMLGYIISTDYLMAFRYVMSLIIVYILRAYTSSFASLRNKVIIPPFIALFATAATGAVVMITSPFDMQQIFLRIAEAVTSFGGAYFFTSSFITADRLKNKQGPTDRELMSLVISVIIIILSMTRLSLFGVSPSGVLCSYIVMAAAYTRGEGGGAAIGTGASLGFMMTGSRSPVSFCYGAAGLFPASFHIPAECFVLWRIFSPTGLCSCSWAGTARRLHSLRKQPRRLFCLFSLRKRRSPPCRVFSERRARRATARRSEICLYRV